MGSIELSEVSKSFGDVAAVDRISLYIESGQAAAVVGPSGSGKTTILRLAAGLEVPDHGRIDIDHREVSHPGWACPPYTRGIGMVFQKPALWPHMTIGQNIAFAITGLSRQATRMRLEEMLRMTHLEGLGSRYPYQVSGGEAQRASLARALAASPSILFLDEPLSGLDWALADEMLDLLRDVKRNAGVTIIYVSHDLNEARSLTSRVVVLERGRVTYDGSWEGVRTGRRLP